MLDVTYSVLWWVHLIFGESYILGMYFLKAMANREDFAKSGMLRRNARIGYCFALVRQHIDIVWIAMSM